MTRLQHPLELLAPAKNADFGIEAIKHGAIDPAKLSAQESAVC